MPSKFSKFCSTNLRHCSSFGHGIASYPYFPFCYHTKVTQRPGSPTGRENVILKKGLLYFVIASRKSLKVIVVEKRKHDVKKHDNFRQHIFLPLIIYNVCDGHILKRNFFLECVEIFLATGIFVWRSHRYISRIKTRNGSLFEGSLRSRSRLFLPRARGSNEELVRGSRESGW